jgi:PAS domain S-box-containing protein
MVILFQKVIKDKLVTISMLIVMILVILATTFTWLNKKRIVETTIIKAQAEMVKTSLGYIFREYLRGMDLGLRGYALTKNKQVLSPYENALTGNATNLRNLDSLFRVQKLDTALARFEKIKEGINNYVEVTKAMKAAVERDSINEFVRLLNQDKGYDLWVLFSPFNNSILKYEDVLIAKAQSDYESALDWNIFIQVILLALGLPSLAYVIYRTNKETKDRQRLLLDLQKNNQDYLFDPGNDQLQYVSLQDAIRQSINNFKKASEFIKGISSKNFEVQWTGMDQTNVNKNNHTLAGELIKMRDQMKLARQDDEQRFWINEGLAQFSQLVRHHQASLPKLCEEATRFLSHYLDAQQGCLFVRNDEVVNDPFLELTAGFAFEHKKSSEKRLDIGAGLLGQAFLDGEPVVLKEVPLKHVEIASGLGHAAPTCLCMIPFKYNAQAEAILELASFHYFEQYKVDFLQRAGEFVASAIVAAKVSGKMQTMLNETQQQAEEMRSQEEEMRQNMEELTATQEEIQRQGEEAKGLLDTTIHILNELPQKVFLKDENGKMVLANINVAKAHNLSVEELIGKSDFDFVDAKTAQEWRDQELEIIKKGSDTYIFDETLNGQTRTLTTTKKAFYIPHLKQTGLLGIQTDITELQALKKRTGKK